MMLDEIITDILKAEGWDTYTNRPTDRGGPTKWGITQKTLAEWRGRDVTEQEVKEITEAQARDIYEKMYVIAPRFNALPNILTPMVVDCGVNHGVRRAAKWVQRAVDATEDGVIGPKTLEAVGRANPVVTYLRICSYRIQLYGKLVTNDPSQAEYAHGWNNRAAKWLVRLGDYLTGV